MTGRRGSADGGGQDSGLWAGARCQEASGSTSCSAPRWPPWVRQGGWPCGMGARPCHRPRPAGPSFRLPTSSRSTPATLRWPSSARHFMLTKVRGRFTCLERHHPPPPTASLSSRAAGWQGTRGMLAGELTICGITRPVSLQAEYLGHVAPRDGRRVVSRPTAPSTARLGASAGTCPGRRRAPGLQGDPHQDRPRSGTPAVSTPGVTASRPSPRKAVRCHTRDPMPMGL